jgi:hypothetical protein
MLYCDLGRSLKAPSWLPTFSPHNPFPAQDKAAVLADVRAIIADQLGTELDAVSCYTFRMSLARRALALF